MNTARGSRSVLHRPRNTREARQLQALEADASTMETSEAKEKAASSSDSKPNPDLDQFPTNSTDTDLVLASTTPPSPEFPLFSLLPLEIRTRIFAFALLDPRSLPNVSFPINSKVKWEDGPVPGTKMAWRGKWPALLHVCHDSREEAIMFYEGIEGKGGMFKTKENQVVRRMGFGDVRGRNRVEAAGWWWDASVFL